MEDGIVEGGIDGGEWREGRNWKGNLCHTPLL